MTTDNTNGDIRLFHRGTRTLHVKGNLGQTVFQDSHLFVGQGTLFQDTFCLFGRQALEILATRRNEQTRHIQSAWTNQQFLVIFFIVTIRTVLPAREHH